MQVYCLTSLDELASYAEDWDRLAADMPLRGWNWLSTWWRHYGSEPMSEETGAQLAVLCVFDHVDDLVGVAPWYIERSATHGRALRPLGAGEVSSSGPGILCRPGSQVPVTEALADYLAELPDAYDPDRLRWDLLELNDVDAEDAAVGRLIRCLADRGAAVHTRPGSPCWRIELPATWDEYLQTLSPDHGEQLRRLQREILATGRAVLHSVDRIDDLSTSIDMLIAMQRRMPRRSASLGPSIFDSTRFAAFQREVMPRLLRSGQLHLHRLEFEGSPVAIEIHLTGRGMVHAFCPAIDQEAAQRHPDCPFDRLATLATLRQAIEQGCRSFDLLGGDESQKAFWHAEPRATVSVEIVPDRAAARWRHHLCLAGNQVKHWLKGDLRWAVEPAG